MSFATARGFSNHGTGEGASSNCDLAVHSDINIGVVSFADGGDRAAAAPRAGGRRGGIGGSADESGGTAGGDSGGGRGFERGRLDGRGDDGDFYGDSGGGLVCPRLGGGGGSVSGGRPRHNRRRGGEDMRAGGGRRPAGDGGLCRARVGHYGGFFLRAGDAGVGAQRPCDCGRRRRSFGDAFGRSGDGAGC